MVNSAQLLNLGHQNISNNIAMLNSSQNFNKKQLSGIVNANITNGFP